MEHWLARLAKGLGCDDNFAAELCRQLTTDFTRRTALDPTDGNYGIVPTSDCCLTYDDQGVGHVETDLVTPDGWTWEVEFSWKCCTHPGERIDHSSAIPDGCEPIFWWSCLPATELAENYGMPVEPPWTEEKGRAMGYSPAEYPFVVEWWALAWPFVYFRIDAGRALSDSDIEDIGNAIIRMQIEWNSDEAHGLIHNVHELRRMADQSCQGFVDFGSAGLQAVVRLLDTLWMLAEELSITQVTFRPSDIS